MNTRGTGRAAAAAQAQDGFADDLDTDWEMQGPGDEDGVQGGGSEGGADPEDAPGQAGEDGEQGDEGELEFEDEPLARPSRGQNRFQALSNELRAERQRAAEMQARLERLERGNQPAQPRVQQRQQDFSLALEPDDQFNARVAQMMPDERSELRQIRAEQRMELRQARADFITMMERDKIAWSADCAEDPLLKSWSKKVEEEHERILRESGNHVNREIIFDALYGKHMRSPENRNRQQRRKVAAQERVRSQEVRPTNPRSDVGGGGRRQLSEREARARRLDGQNI